MEGEAYGHLAPAVDRGARRRDRDRLGHAESQPVHVGGGATADAVVPVPRVRRARHVRHRQHDHRADIDLLSDRLLI